MKKKKEKKEEVIEKVMLENIEQSVNEHTKQKIGKLDLDFGREDLNKLKDKVNEIIDAI